MRSNSLPQQVGKSGPICMNEFLQNVAKLRGVEVQPISIQHTAAVTICSWWKDLILESFSAQE